MKIYLKFISTIIALFTLMCFSTEESFAQSSYTADNEEILIIGDREHAPFEYIDEDGNPSGYSVDLIEYIMKKHSIRYRIRLRNHANAVNRITSGDADIILFVYNIHSEDSLMLVSRPLHKIHTVAICDSKLPPISLSDLKNYKVVLPEQSFIIPDIKNYLPEENRVYVDNLLDAMRLVQNSKYDLALLPNTTAHYYMEHNKFENLSIRDLKLGSHTVRFGVNKNRPDLLELVDNGLDEAIKDGTFHKIYQKWFGYDESFASYPAIIKYIIIIGGILFVVMIVIICYTLIQSKKIQRLSSSETSKGEFYKSHTSTLLDAVPVGVAIYAGDGNLVYINGTLADMFSIVDAKEYIRAGHNIYDNPLISDFNKTRIRKGEDFDFMLTYTSDIDARYRYAYIPIEDAAYFECKIRHVKSPNLEFSNSIYFVLNDVTTLQVAQKNIESHTNCLNLALGVGNIRVWSCDIATSMIYRQYDDVIGTSSEVYPYRDFLNRIHHDDLAKFLEVWDELLSLRSEIGEVTARILDEHNNYAQQTLKMKVMFESSGMRSQTMRIIMVTKM